MAWLKEQVRGLVVLLDPGFTLEAQVVSVTWIGFSSSGWFAHAHQLLNRHSLVVVIHSLVASPLDYCNLLHMGLPLKVVHKLKLVQNMAPRVLTSSVTQTM